MPSGRDFQMRIALRKHHLKTFHLRWKHPPSQPLFRQFRGLSGRIEKISGPVSLGVKSSNVGSITTSSGDKEAQDH
jgi:hypothetical protein